MKTRSKSQRLYMRKTRSKLQRHITCEILERERGHFKLDSGGAANANHLAGTGRSTRGDGSCRNSSNMAELGAIKEANANHLAGTADINIIRTDTGRNTRGDDGYCSNMAEVRGIKEDSDSAANANQGTAEISRIGDGSKQAFKNGSNMGELRAIKEGYYKLDSDGAANGNHSAGTVEIMRTADGPLVVASDARDAFENGSNMAELRAIKEGTGGNTRTLAVACARHAFKKGSNNIVVLRVIKEGSYSGCTVEFVVSGENEKMAGKITLDLSRKAEIKRQEYMATLIQLQKRLETLRIKRAQGSSMESLPSDVVQDIVSRVPAESVLECKLVCKKWVTLIRETNFANMHVSRQLNRLYGGEDGSDNIAAKVESCLFFACQIDGCKTLLFHGQSDKISIDEKYDYNENLKRIYHPPMHKVPLNGHLVGSCNGLVCILHPHHRVLDPIYICNPLTREYVYLPELVVKKEDIDPDLIRIVRGEVNMLGNTACGFGYVRSTNEYKVVRIYYPLKYREGNVEVYTLGGGCGWRAIGRVPYRVETWSGGRGTYANGAIYWISSWDVVAFDLAKEEFRLLTAPPCMQNLQPTDAYGLAALGSHLCLFVNGSRLGIWSLMNSSDSKETWCMEYDIDHEAVLGSFSLKREFLPILFTKGREIIFLYNKSVLYCYDTKTTLLRMISDEASTDYFKKVEAIAYLNTFASLEAMGESSRRYTVRPPRARTPWDDVIDVIEELDRVDLGEEIDTTRFRLK